MENTLTEHQEHLGNLFEQTCENGGKKVAEIQTYLKKIELDYNVKILYACESGSRAWKIHSPDSDFDIRFVYMHPMQWYTQISHQPDHMVFQEPEMNADIVGWEMRKALKLYAKSNTNFYGWLKSGIVYQYIPFFSDCLLEMMPEFYTRKAFFHHHLSHAKRTYQDYIRIDRDTVNIKKYIYVLQSLISAQWIVEMGNDPNRLFPPIEFHALVGGTLTHQTDLRYAIENLLAWKHSNSERAYDHRIPIIDEYIEKQMKTLPELAEFIPKPDGVPKLHKLDKLIWGAIWQYGL